MTKMNPNIYMKLLFSYLQRPILGGPGCCTIHHKVDTPFQLLDLECCNLIYIYDDGKAYEYLYTVYGVGRNGTLWCISRNITLCSFDICVDLSVGIVANTTPIVQPR